MDEVVEKIVDYTLDELRYFGNCDKYTILEEVVSRLRIESDNALKDEYFNEYISYE